jgi:hypothetical protein
MADYAALIRPTTLRRVPNKATSPLTLFLSRLHSQPSRSQRDAFREGTPEGGAGAVLVERSDTLRSRAAWASSRPARAGPRGARCTGAGEGPPVCIRWFQEARPEPSRGLKNLGCRGGAPKGERARSMRSRRPWSSQHEGKEKGRAPHPFSMRLLVDALVGAPPPFFLRGGAFLGMLLAWLSWRGQSSDA